MRYGHRRNRNEPDACRDGERHNPLPSCTPKREYAKQKGNNKRGDAQIDRVEIEHVDDQVMKNDQDEDGNGSIPEQPRRPDRQCLPIDATGRTANVDAFFNQWSVRSPAIRSIA